jgi:hypothetical protein
VAGNAPSFCLVGIKAIATPQITKGGRGLDHHVQRFHRSHPPKEKSSCFARHYCIKQCPLCQYIFDFFSYTFVHSTDTDKDKKRRLPQRSRADMPLTIPPFYGMLKKGGQKHLPAKTVSYKNRGFRW